MEIDLKNIDELSKLVSSSRVAQNQLMQFKDSKINNLILKIISSNDNYTYHYSVDSGNTFEMFSKTAANLVLCKGYIGTNLGIYATSNGNKTKEYAEFNWVKNLIK